MPPPPAPSKPSGSRHGISLSTAKSTISKALTPVKSQIAELAARFDSFCESHSGSMAPGPDARTDEGESSPKRARPASSTGPSQTTATTPAALILHPQTQQLQQVYSQLQHVPSHPTPSVPLPLFNLHAFLASQALAQAQLQATHLAIQQAALGYGPTSQPQQLLLLTAPASEAIAESAASAGVSSTQTASALSSTPSAARHTRRPRKRRRPV